MELQKFEGTNSGFTDASFSPDGEKLAVGTCDGSVIVRTLDLELLTSNLENLISIGSGVLKNYLENNSKASDDEPYSFA